MLFYIIACVIAFIFGFIGFPLYCKSKGLAVIFMEPHTERIVKVLLPKGCKMVIRGTDEYDNVPKDNDEDE